MTLKVVLQTALMAVFLCLSLSAQSMNGAGGGIIALWHKNSTLDIFGDSYVDGGQVLVYWGEAYGGAGFQTGANAWNYNQANDQFNKIYGTYGKPVIIQLGANFKPTFMASSVSWCNRHLSHQEKTTINGVDATYAYWENKYQEYANLAVKKLADWAASKPAHAILAVRQNKKQFGTEHSGDISSCAAENNGTWTKASGWTSAGHSNWSLSNNYNAYLDNYPPLGIPVYFKEPGTNLAQADVASALNNDKAVPYNTGMEPEPRYNSDIDGRYGPQRQWCKNDGTRNPDNMPRCFSEIWADSTGYKGGPNDPRPWGASETTGGPAWNYWAILNALNSGVSYVGIYTSDLIRGRTIAEYGEVFAWARELMGYHLYPSQSPGAWYAFREGNVDPGNYCFLFERNNYDDSVCPITVNSGTFTGLDWVTDGSSEFGSTRNIYTGWARKLSAGGSITMNLNQEFATSTNGDPVEIEIDYFDKGSGTVTLSAFGQTSQATKTNSLTWKTHTWVVTSNGNKAIGVSVASSSTNLSAIRVNRTTAAPTPTPPPPTDAFTAFNQGNPIEAGTNPYYFGTDSAVDTNGVISVCIVDQDTNQACIDQTDASAGTLNDNANGGRTDWNDGAFDSLTPGDVTVKLQYATPVYDSAVDAELISGSTYNTSLTDYTGSEYGSAGGVIVENTGTFGNTAMSTTPEFDANSGDTIHILYKFKKVPGDSDVLLQITTDTSEYYRVSGPLGSLTIQDTDTGSGHTLQQWSRGDIYFALLSMTATVTDEYEYKMGSDSGAIGDKITPLRVQAWVNRSPTEITIDSTYQETTTTTPVTGAYYVKNGGNDSSDGLSPATAWASLSTSIGKLDAGDTLLLECGSTFTPTSKTNITKSNLTLNQYGTCTGNNHPTLDGQSHTEPTNFTTNGHYSGAIDINTGANGVTIAGIKINEVGGTGISVNGNNATIDNVQVVSPVYNGIIVYTQAQNTKIINSEIEHTNWGYENRGSYSIGGQTYNPSTWGQGINNQGVNTLVNNVDVWDSVGEGIGFIFGATGGTISNSRVGSGAVGIYFDSTQDVDVFNNVVYGLNGAYKNVSGIGFNVENNSYSQALSRDRSPVTQNIRLFNNVVSGFKNGLWLACQYCRDNDPAQNNADELSGICIHNNTLADNERSIQFDNGGDWTGSYVQNNIFQAYDQASPIMINGLNSPDVKPTFTNNAWSVSPGYGSGNVIGGVLLSKTSGWLTANWGDISISDFAPQAGSTTIDAGTSTICGGSRTYTTDINGGAVSTIDIGAIDDSATAPVAPSNFEIIRVNSNNTVIPGTQNTAEGTGLDEVLGGRIIDNESDQEALINVFGLRDGTATFTTGSMTGVDVEPYTIELDSAPVLQRPTLLDMSGWSMTVAADPGSYWVYDTNCVSVQGNTANLFLAGESFAVTAGEILTLRAVYAAGSSGKVRIGFEAQSDNSKSAASGDIGSATCYGNAAGVCSVTETALNQDGLYLGEVTTTAGLTDNYKSMFGSAGDASDVKLCDLQVIKNKAANTVTTSFDLSQTSTPTLVGLNGNGIADPNQQNIATGTLLNQVQSVVISDSDSGVIDEGGTEYSYPIAVGTEDGLSLYFRTQDLSDLVAPIYLRATYSPVAYESFDPTGWVDSTAGTGTRTNYTHDKYGFTNSVEFGSGGKIWHSLVINGAFDVSAGDTITCDQHYTQGTSGLNRFRLVNGSDSSQVNAEGIPGALAITTSGAAQTDTASVTEYVNGDHRVTRLSFTSAAAGSYNIFNAPASETAGESIIIHGVRCWKNFQPNEVELQIDVSGAGVEEFGSIKSIKWANGTDDNRVMLNGQFFTGDVRCKGYDKSTHSGSAQELFEGNVEFTAGEGTITESSLISGSINQFLSGKSFWLECNNQVFVDIENVTQANPAVITATGHGIPETINGVDISSKNWGYVRDVLGMTELNGGEYLMTVVDENTISIDVDATGFSAYQSGGVLVSPLYIDISSRAYLIEAAQ